MASINYLWKNRKQFPFGSRSFFAAWAKRALTLPVVLKRNRMRVRLVKKGATIDETAEVGNVRAEGNKQHLSVGAHSFLGRIELGLHDEIIIKNNVCINDGVIILTASHKIDDPLWRHKKAAVVINDYAWIATNAIILPGVSIGRGAVVGAGAVVSKNVADYNIVAGNPAVIINKKRVEDLRYDPCEFLAGNMAWLKG